MNKRRGWPFPDAAILKSLTFKLEEALQVENFFRPNLLTISQNDSKLNEVTLSSRDAAVNILRFLRVWLDIPHFVFFSAVSYLDLFLERMKVHEKFLRCLTVSCLYLAMEKENLNVDLSCLLKVSQSRCTTQDVLRMAIIVKEKIKVVGDAKPTTPADFLKIFIKIFKCVTKQWEHIIAKDLILLWEKMLILLEVLLVDSSTAYLRPSVMALLVFQREVEKILAQGLPNKSVYYLGEVLQFLSIIREIQLKCKIRNDELKAGYLQIFKVLKQYESKGKNYNHQILRWDISLSSLQMSVKQFGYHPMFQTINE